MQEKGQRNRVPLYAARAHESRIGSRAYNYHKHKYFWPSSKLPRIPKITNLKLSSNFNKILIS